MEVKRTEHKFIVNQKERLILERRLQQVMPRDVHCRHSSGYEIRSLYFDTLEDRCCAEKEDGLRVHEKIRVRIYGTDDSVIKLESKKKAGEYQTKTTMAISRAELDALLDGRYAVLLKNPDPHAPYFYRKFSEGLFPRVIIRYKRLSFCLPINNTRITFDSDIRATESNFDLFQDPMLDHPIFPADQVIAEVKFNSFLLGYIKDALRTLQSPETSFSKYFSGRMFYRHMI